MKIVVDLDELVALARIHQDATQQLAGLASVVRRRFGSGLLERLRPYGIIATGIMTEGENLVHWLVSDARSLERLALEVERVLVRAEAATGTGSLGALGASYPDLWWFNSVAANGQVAAAQSAVAAGGTGAALEQHVVLTAERWVGTPYGWAGGHGRMLDPHSAPVDCSGLVDQVYGANGINLHGGNAQSMYAMGTPVGRLADAQPGDLLFWGTPHHIHHVAIYIGNGQMIEAPHPGATVHVTAVRTVGDFAGIRHLVKDAQAVA